MKGIFKWMGKIVQKRMFYATLCTPLSLKLHNFIFFGWISLLAVASKNHILKF